MRSWHPIPPLCLDRKRLLGEHVEVHAIWNIIVAGKAGYRHHPEVKRWRDHLPALAERHDALVAEMERRGYNHKSPIEITCSQITAWPATIEPVETMREKLAIKVGLAAGDAP
jgi:hypothetical protein